MRICIFTISHSNALWRTRVTSCLTSVRRCAHCTSVDTRVTHTMTHPPSPIDESKDKRRKLRALIREKRQIRLSGTAPPTRSSASVPSTCDRALAQLASNDHMTADVLRVAQQFIGQCGGDGGGGGGKANASMRRVRRMLTHSLGHESAREQASSTLEAHYGSSGSSASQSQHVDGECHISRRPQCANETAHLDADADDEEEEEEGLPPIIESALSST